MFYPDPRQNFDSTSPLFFRIHVSSLSSREGVHPKNNGEVMPKSSQEGVEHGTRLDLHILGLSKTWTIRKRYGYKYAKMDNHAYL